MLNDAQDQAQFLKIAPQELVERLGSWKVEARRSKRRLHVAIVGVFAITLLPLVCLGILLVQADRIVSVAIAKIPIEWEEDLGQHLKRSYLREHSVFQDGAATRAVRQISDRLIESIESPYTFNVVLVEDSAANAFALPGGVIVICSGLLSENRKPEELAGVLAHEIQHIQQRHGIRALVRGMGLSFALQLLFRGDELRGTMIHQMQQLEGHRYSRQQESEADLAAVDLLQSAHIDPLGLATFFERFSGLTGDPPILFATHPSSNLRAQKIREAITTQMYTPLNIDWDEVVFEILVAHKLQPAQTTIR